jgi:hypothetical protein
MGCEEKRMHHLKMLSLAAVMTLGLTSLIGAGTASATTLFTDSNLTTPYKAGTELHLTMSSGRVMAFTDGSGNPLISCTASTAVTKTSNETGTTVFSSITILTFGGCDTTVDVLANGSLEIERTGPNEGKVVGKGSQWTYSIFGVSCTYGTGKGTTLGTVTGGISPVLSINAVGITKVAGGFLCPSNMGWDASYTFTTPHAIYIGA